MKKTCTEADWFAAVIAEALGLPVGPIMSGDRTRKYSLARWRAFRRLADQNFSFASIGRVSGYNHTSVMHAVNELRAGRIAWSMRFQRNLWLERLTDGKLVRTPNPFYFSKPVDKVFSCSAHGQLGLSSSRHENMEAIGP